MPFWSKKSKSPAIAASTDASTRIYAIGDIHGRYDLLQRIHELINQDTASASANIHKIIVYIGDYIDRGLESKQVIESFISNKIANFQHIFIKGNHEHAMLGFLEDPAIGEMWLNWGGYATLQSYLGSAIVDGHRRDMASLSKMLKNSLPESHFNFLNNLQLSYVNGDYIFVHAGVRPGLAFANQTEDDMLMIRGEFIYSQYPIPGKTVIFGHTIFDAAFCDAGKIAIDTGAYATGKLTAAVLEGSAVRFITT